MKTVEYDILDIPVDYIDLDQQNRVIAELLRRHGKRETFAYCTMLGAISRLPRVLWAVNGEIRGKVVMDLGSGATHGYEPWFCRALHVLGAYPIAVDLGAFEGEDFECHSMDFTDPRSLKTFPDNYVDIATFNNVSTSREWRESRRDIPYRLHQIVKPDGFFLYEK